MQKKYAYIYFAALIFIFSAVFLVSCSNNREKDTASSVTESKLSSSESAVSQIFSDVPDQVTLEALYKKAVEAYEWFEITPMKFSNDSPVIENGIDYYKVSHDTIKSFENLENYLKTLFSDEIVKELSDKKCYKNINGSLFATKATRDKKTDKGQETYSYMKVSDTEIIYKVTVENLKEDKKTVKDSTVYDFVYKKVNGKWSFTDFPYFR